MEFKTLKLADPILQAIEEAGYERATEIQQQAIPFILEGNDIIGCAQTGTGKTAAFAIPVLQHHQINTPVKKGAIRTLVLTPTRELALQIYDNFKVYGKHLKTTYAVIFGGVSQNKQVSTLKGRPEVLIATPGRLLDLMGQGFINLSHIEILVLDEADRMLDMGFVNDVKKVLTKVPAKKQTLFFSATMPPSIRKFAASILRNPKEVTVTPVSSTAKTVKQGVFFVDKKDKNQLLINLLNEERTQRTLVFTRTKHGADKLVKHLGRAGITAAAIHGNKSQNARQRALDDFKGSRINVLIATDIAARGIDIDELPFVVNFELPNVPETYVHRIGRTGRAGMEGSAISFCDQEEMSDLKSIQKLIGFNLPVKQLETMVM